MRRIDLRRFALVLVVLVVGTVLAEVVLVRSGWGALSLWVVVLAGLVGLVSVAWLSQPEAARPATLEPAPVTPGTVPPPTSVEEDEPFDDPVEAADREETAAAPAPDLTAGDPPDDGLE